MGFSVEFEKVLIFQGFKNVLSGIVVIFDGVGSGEMLDFTGFCRSRYRTRKLEN